MKCHLNGPCCDDKLLQVMYTALDGTQKTKGDIHGYYYEMDYGSANNRPPSLQYIQLYDVWEPIALAGTLRVQADGAHTYCTTTYDYN